MLHFHKLGMRAPLGKIPTVSVAAPRFNDQMGDRGRKAEVDPGKDLRDSLNGTRGYVHGESEERVRNPSTRLRCRLHHRLGRTWGISLPRPELALADSGPHRPVLQLFIANITTLRPSSQFFFARALDGTMNSRTSDIRTLGKSC